MVTQQVYDPTEWSRFGRGRELQFFATEVELRRWLAALPERYGPYQIWGSRLREGGNGEHERVLFCHSLGAFTNGVSHEGQEGSDLAHQFFLHAAKLMPELPSGSGVARLANDWASLNGLVLVQHGATRFGMQLCSRIAVNDRIRNRTSGDVVSLAKRTLVFDALRKLVVRDLRFTSIQVFRDGHEEEDEVQLMTADAAELAARGHFVRRPGRPLSPEMVARHQL